uniref:NADH-ubiquinone oxidoreductase chain 2 n=1 Tax=Siboglinum ekmani TaxID=167800 RepID=A0A0E3DQV4_9ANNE|nr:NADH dehydrogenase subunit 2 [Siboglinum ekmani]
MIKFIIGYPLFLFMFILGTLMSASSSHWLYFWIGMEVSLFNIIPLMISSSNSFSLESSIKYFLIQIFSSIMLMTSMLSLFMPLMFNNLIIFFFFLLSMMTKLSLVPCHFWFPPIISSISWPMCFILMTWQKLIPLFIFMFLFMSPPLNLIWLVIILSSILSGISGLNQTQLRPLLAYSSINHMSWVMSLIFLSPMLSLSYFMFYSLLLFPLLITIYLNNISSNKQMFNMFFLYKSYYFLFVILLLSLGGLPPFLGFFPKWFSIMFLINNNMFLLLSFLILGSMINLYYYLMLLFPFMNFMSMKMYYSFKKKEKNFAMWFSMLSMGLFPLILFSI